MSDKKDGPFHLNHRVLKYGAQLSQMNIPLR